MSSIAAKYAEILGKYGHVYHHRLSMALIGMDYTDLVGGGLQWKNRENVFPAVITTDVDFTNCRARHYLSGTVTEHVEESKPLLAATHLANALRTRQDITPNTAQGALEEFGDLTLPVWRIVHQDALALAVAKEALAALAVEVAQEEAKKAALAVRLRLWAESRNLVHLIVDEKLVLVHEVLASLPREVQEDIIAFAVSGSKIVLSLTGEEWNTAVSWFPKGALAQVVNGGLAYSEEVYLGSAAGLQNPENWGQGRASIRLLAEHPIRWVEAGASRDVRRRRALSIPAAALLNMEELSTEENSEVVHRVLRIMTRIEELTQDELVEELKTLPSWGRTLSCRTRGETQTRVYAALQEARSAPATG